jgi:8-oxo-dGTP pyrophosphatase MutT (NUDIX family)
MEETDGGSKCTGPLSLRLKGVLQDIHDDECPVIPNPPGCKKRAAVALVIRIRPSSPQEAVFDQENCSSSSQSFQASLDNFFSQSWIQHGDPEVLFIKRAARAGDRWTSHIAFPGGKRDPGDSDDRATSVRETMEETGLDLNTDHSLFIGNLPERVIRMMWGETP